MVMSAEHRSKCAALHRKWGRLHMLEWDGKPQTYKATIYGHGIYYIFFSVDTVRGFDNFRIYVDH